MREFRYSALASDGTIVNGSRLAADGDALARELLEQRLVLLKNRPILGLRNLNRGGRSRISNRELIEFTQHLATCLAAGIPLISALADFEEQSGKELREVVRDVRSSVNSGASLAEALSRHPRTFGPVYLAMSKVGGNTGNMDRVLIQLVDYLEWSDGLKSQLKQAMVYPAMLMMAIIGLFLLLMFFLIPRFSTTFAEVNFELPALTRNMMAIGDFMGHWWWLVLGAMAGAVASFKTILKSQHGRYQWDRLILKLPVVGNFAGKVALSRFARSFSLMFSSGLDLIRVLTLLEGIVGNAVMAGELKMIRLRVVTGESLTASFANAGTFPPMVLRLIAVGESTGTLDSSLLKAAEAFDREIPRELKKALSVFDAIIIAILGTLICLAALSLLLPIMEIQGAIH